MGMSKYKIKETNEGRFLVFKLQDMGNGYCFLPVTEFRNREAAEAYIEKERKAKHEK